MARWSALVVRRGSGAQYDGGVAERVIESEELDVDAMVADMRPPTVDDVPIAADGTLLDTPAKVRAYVDELNRRRVTS
jgi:hypothetical protein